MKIPSLLPTLAYRLAVAAPIIAGIGWLRAWFGEPPSALIGLLTGVGAYAFADWMLSTPEERQARIRHVTAFFREHGTVGTKWAMYLAMSIYFFGSHVEPAEPAVKQLLSLVQFLGLFAVFVVPAVCTWSVAGLVARFLSSLAFYSMALWVIGHSGDDIYKWVLANPNDVAIGAASLAIVWMIVLFSAGPSHGQESIARSSGAAAGAMTGIAMTPTARDNRYTAAHEAGHALVYAALGRLPPYVKLAINERPDHSGVLGFVRGIRSRHQLDEKTFAEWYMLVFLAGKMGESAMLGETTLGSSNDHARWLNVARRYLSNHYKGMFYAEPQNEFEQKQNETKLEALQTEQLTLLGRLFDLNADVFKELATALLEKRTLTRDELIPFLSRVQLPPEFPLPFGVFDQFAGAGGFDEQELSQTNDRKNVHENI